jgi:transcriptional regulator with XRE-family HTH domain
VANAHDTFSPQATGARVLEHRHAGRWSQKGLADEMTARGFAWHQNTVFRVERGERRVTLEEAGVLAEIFSVELGALGCAA